MARFAIGDIQGCLAPLRELLRQCNFRSDRDEIWFVGDLVNRGPDSLEVLRFVRALGGNAAVVLGNHDLHLLALAYGAGRGQRAGDTLNEILRAPDRDILLSWLLARPLAYYDEKNNDLLIHGGLLPQWTVAQTLQLAGEVTAALQRDPVEVFANMYGNKPDRWDDDLGVNERRRVIINALTRMRFCTAQGRMDVKLKGAPDSAPAPWMPWFTVPGRASASARIIFGHWSTLGWHDGNNVLALDTGCVWGGALTAVRLEAPAKATSLRSIARWSVPCEASQSPGGD